MQLFQRFFFRDNRSEVVGDVLYSANVEQVGMDMPVEFDDSRSSGFRLPHFVMNDDHDHYHDAGARRSSYKDKTPYSHCARD